MHACLFIFALIYTPLLCPHVLISWSHVTEDLSTSLLYLSNLIYTYVVYCEVLLCIVTNGSYSVLVKIITANVMILQ